jgi:hypothetical protein
MLFSIMGIISGPQLVLRLEKQMISKMIIVVKRMHKNRSLYP